MCNGWFFVWRDNGIKLYTELAYIDSSKTAIIPKGVFGLDSPIDLTEIYNSFHSTILGFDCNGKRDKISEQTR